jgi:hypothetical protein
MDACVHEIDEVLKELSIDENPWSSNIEIS